MANCSPFSMCFVNYAICSMIALNTVLYSFVICQTILRYMLKMTKLFVVDGRDWNGILNVQCI